MPDETRTISVGNDAHNPLGPHGAPGGYSSHDTDTIDNKESRIVTTNPQPVIKHMAPPATKVLTRVLSYNNTIFLDWTGTSTDLSYINYKGMYHHWYTLKNFQLLQLVRMHVDVYIVHCYHYMLFGELSDSN